MKRLSSLIIVLALASIAASCNVSTANLTDVKTGTEIKNSAVVKEIKVFEKDTPQIYVSANLNNAPEGTKITFTWRYLEQGGQDIDSVTVESKSDTNVANSVLSKPKKGWPPGNYEVVVKLDTENSKPITKKFKVE